MGVKIAFFSISIKAEKWPPVIAETTMSLRRGLTRGGWKSRGIDIIISIYMRKAVAQLKHN